MPVGTLRYRWQELTDLQRAALDEQIVELANAFCDDVRALQEGEPFADTTLASFLPRQFLPVYTLALAKRFLVAFLTITWKLKDIGWAHHCANQAEELALFALIQATGGALPAGEDDLGAFEEVVFEDNDFLYLFDPALDGIAEALAPVDPSITAYHPKDWFEPFNDSDRPVHPYQLLAPRPVAGRDDPAREG